MGQKAHPLGVRLKAIETKLAFKKIGTFSSKTFFYEFYNHSFVSKGIVGKKLTNAVITERFIISWLSSKFSIFVNKILLVENSSHFFIIIEFYSLDVSILNTDQFKKNICIIQKHIESKLLFNKPIKFFLVNLNRKLDTLTSKINLSFKDNYKRYRFGSSVLVNVGFLSNYWPCASLFSSLFCHFFKRTSDHNKILDFTNQLFLFLFSIKNSRFKGLRLEIKGRINSADRSQKRVISQGSLPLQSLSTDSFFLSYGFAESKTSYGVFGIRVFFSYKLVNSF